MRDEHRSQLDRLQAAWARLTGKKPPQQDVLGEAVAFATKHRNQFLAEAVWRPPQASVQRRWLSMGEDLGPWTTADIDAIVYEDSA
ncbi:MAG: hypothetical protein ACYDDF_12765 [Thermoplasmatota archaeon]